VDSPSGTAFGDFIDFLNLQTGGVILLLWLLYALCQWLSMVVRHSALAAIAAPLMVAAMVLFLYVALRPGEHSRNYFWLSIALPLAMTYWATWSSMNDRRGLRRWIPHGLFFTAFWLLPLASYVPALFGPTMPSAMRSKLLPKAMQLYRAIRPYQQLGLMAPEEFDRQTNQHALFHRSGRTFVPVETLMKREFGDYSRYVLEAVEKKLKQKEAIFRFDSNVVKFLTSEAILHRHAQRSDEYQHHIELLDQLSSRFRQWPVLIYQDRCDVLDRWLLGECIRSEASQLLRATVIKTITDRIADQEILYRARRDALLASWGGFEEGLQEESSFQEFGGYDLALSGRDYGSVPYLARRRYESRKVSKVAYELIQALDQMAPKKIQDQSPDVIAALRFEQWQRLAAVSKLPVSTYQAAFEKPLDDLEFEAKRPFLHWFGRWEKATP
jgi:hypothetical protein